VGLDLLFRSSAQLGFHPQSLLLLLLSSVEVVSAGEERVVVKDTTTLSVAVWMGMATPSEVTVVVT